MIYEMVFFKLWGENGQDETLLKFQNFFSLAYAVKES